MQNYWKLQIHTRKRFQKYSKTIPNRISKEFLDMTQKTFQIGSQLLVHYKKTSDVSKTSDVWESFRGDRLVAPTKFVVTFCFSHLIELWTLQL
jgi:hypothetical protein